MSDPIDVQKLLRLKRYEQPPEGYFEDFLAEFQRRQRTEMLRRPLLQIWFDRVSCWLGEFRVPSVAYAAILVAALAAGGLMLNGSLDPNPAGSARMEMARAVDRAAFAIESSGSTASAPQSVPAHLPPSYVLETRPVSYEAPFSF